MDDDHSLVPLSIGEHRQRRNARCPTQGEPADAEHEWSALQIDAEGLPSERSIGRDIDEGAVPQKAPNPMETAKPGLRIPVRQPDDVSDVEGAASVDRGRPFRAVPQTAGVAQGPQDEPRLGRTKVESEQHRPAREGSEMLFSENDDVAAQIVQVLDAHERLLRHEPAVIGEERQRDTPAIPSRRAPSRSATGRCGDVWRICQIGWKSGGRCAF